MPSPVLKSVLVNVSGQRTYFDFLVPGGQYLNPGDTWEYWGDIFDWMRHSGDGATRTKKARALEHCINEGLIEVRQYTESVLYDETLGLSKLFLVDDNSIVLRDSSAGIQQEADIVIGGSSPPPSVEPGFVADGNENTAYYFSGSGGTEPVGDEIGNGSVDWNTSGNVGDSIVIDTDMGGDYALRTGPAGINTIQDPVNVFTTGDVPTLAFWMKYATLPVSPLRRTIIDFKIGGGGLYVNRPSDGGKWEFGIGVRRFDVEANIDADTWYHISMGQQPDGTYFLNVGNGSTGSYQSDVITGRPLQDYTFGGGSDGLLMIQTGTDGGELLLDDIRIFKQPANDLQKLASQRGSAA